MKLCCYEQIEGRHQIINQKFEAGCVITPLQKNMCAVQIIDMLSVLHISN